MELVVVADPVAAKKADRARKAREHYAANREAERARRRDGMARARANGGPQKSIYDVDDYVEEWSELTWLGMDAARIIAGSDPSEDWFLTWVMPRVSVAKCSSCGRVFDPSQTGTLITCSTVCRASNNNAWGRHS